MSIKLHQLTDLGLQIQEAIESNPEFDISKALVDFQGEFNTKALDLGMVYRNIQAEADVYETESKRLADKAKSLNKRAEGLRIYIEQQMELLGIEAIKGDTFSVKFHKLPPSVDIINADLIPLKYKRHNPESYEPNKVAILEALSNGIKIDGAKLNKDKKKLYIK
jgi:hypothetical protein